MAMKATGLMIGDWVNYSILNLNAKVFSILGNHTIGIQFVDKNNKIEAIHGLLEETIIPIPLTEEILVNNGFVGVPLTDSYELNTDYYEIEVWNYSDGLWVVNVHWIEFSSTPESKATVSYVHELQHLFRLCGVEKELVID